MSQPLASNSVPEPMVRFSVSVNGRTSMVSFGLFELVLSITKFIKSFPAYIVKSDSAATVLALPKVISVPVLKLTVSGLK